MRNCVALALNTVIPTFRTYP